MPDAEVPRSLRFLVSACAFERHSYVASLVANVLDNTSPQTHLVLNYNGSRTVLRDSDRAHLNPQYHAVKRWHSSILHAHASNVLWINKSGLLAFDFVILQASNMFWCRPGMEKYVWRHERSTGYVRVGSANRCADQLSCESKCRTKRDFAQQTHDGPTGLLDPCHVPRFGSAHTRVLVQGKHEGSFYRAAEFLRAYQEFTGLESWSAHPCRARTLTSITDFWHPLEEIVWPTWFANFYGGNNASAQSGGHTLTHWLIGKDTRRDHLDRRLCARLPEDKFAVKGVQCVSTSDCTLGCGDRRAEALDSLRFNQSRFRCTDRSNYRGGCVKHAPCPMVVKSLSACKAECARAKGCRSLVFNRYSHCYLKATDKDHVVEPSMQHGTIGCVHTVGIGR